MILNGLLHTHIQHNGHMLLKMVISVLVFTLFLCSCSADWWVGDGRGDWTLDLSKGYAISKINSNEILLVHKENINDSGGSIVVPNYFIISYQLREPYICLEGICTRNVSASDEELNDMVLSYYLVDTSSGKVSGPFNSHDDYIAYCSSLALETKDEWILINK